MCAATIRGKSVLITGAAGFIASELARQVFAFGPATLHLVDVNETGLYDLQRDLEADDSNVARRASGCATSPTARRWTTCSARRGRTSSSTRRRTSTSPSWRTTRTRRCASNVVGTLNVCTAASDARRGEVGLRLDGQGREPGQRLRRDEAHRRAAGQRGWPATASTTFAAVRFGNVMGSRGSVVPLFLRQIERGGPVLLTDPETTRYFMSAEEAASLVIQAASFADQGQIFILDMGEKVRIADLAEKMIRLKGLRAGARHPDRLHRPARRREAARGAGRHVREAAEHAPPEDLPHAGAPDRQSRDEIVGRSTRWRTSRRATARRSRRACTRSPASTCATPGGDRRRDRRADGRPMTMPAHAYSDRRRELRRDSALALSSLIRQPQASPVQHPHRRRRAAAVHQGGRVLARRAAAAHRDPRAHRASTTTRRCPTCSSTSWRCRGPTTTSASAPAATARRRRRCSSASRP